MSSISRLELISKVIMPHMQHKNSFIPFEVNISLKKDKIAKLIKSNLEGHFLNATVNVTFLPNSIYHIAESIVWETRRGHKLKLEDKLKDKFSFFENTYREKHQYFRSWLDYDIYLPVDITAIKDKIYDTVSIRQQMEYGDNDVYVFQETGERRTHRDNDPFVNFYLEKSPRQKIDDMVKLFSLPKILFRPFYDSFSFTHTILSRIFVDDDKYEQWLKDATATLGEP